MMVPPGGHDAQGHEPVAPPSVCYVTSHYPALSHTFVMREVLGVRALGVGVSTVSVHQADPDHLLAQVDKQEAAQTWNIFPLDKRAFLAAHLKAALRHPRAYAATLAHAFGASPPGLRAHIWQLIYFAEAIHLWGHAKALGAEHFHAHLANVATDISWLACAFGKEAEPRRHWRWSFTMHGSLEFYWVERFNLRRKVANADAVICVSEYTRSQMMYVSDPSHWGKLRVVHCGADLERYPYVEPADHDFVCVLSVCRLVPEKGLDLLVEAIAALRAGGDDVRLVLVGGGPLERPLRERVRGLGIEGAVKFVGAIGQDHMADYYAESDIFCLPSFAEGVPVVMMEAMATGRPVVASRITGIPELVEDGVSGLLFTAGNVEQLTAALSRLVSSPALRRELGQAGRATVAAQFNSGASAAQMADVFVHMASSETAAS